MLAVENSHMDCVQFLLNQGASVEKITEDGSTVLHLAETKEIAKLLLDAGANPHAIDNLERTAYELHMGNRFDNHNKTEPGGSLHGKALCEDSSQVHLAFQPEHRVRHKRKRHKRRLTIAERNEVQKEVDEALQSVSREHAYFTLTPMTMAYDAMYGQGKNRQTIKLRTTLL